MNKKTIAVGTALFLSLSSRLAFADFHLWIINEVYSNTDGTVQFIELTTAAEGQGVLGGHSIISVDATQTQRTLNFSNSLTGTTANKSVLIATETFASLTGMTPDYIIENSFVPLTGGSLNFGEGSDVLEFTQSMLPLNGLQSIDSNAQAQTATPTNFLGLTATVSTDSYASFDVAASTMRVPVVDIPGIGIANLSFTVDLESIEFTLNNDFYLFGPGITAGDNPAQLQNNNTLYIPGLTIGTDLYEFNMTLLESEPIVFGNLAVLSVTNLLPSTPIEEPEPVPDNGAAELQASIDRGQSEFSSQCAACHGVSGVGGIGPNLRTSSFNTFNLLRNEIELTMPQGNPAACRDSGSFTCATDIANFVLNVFQN